jgi:hypothetical protein
VDFDLSLKALRLQSLAGLSATSSQKLLIRQMRYRIPRYLLEDQDCTIPHTGGANLKEGNLRRPSG